MQNYLFFASHEDYAQKDQGAANAGSWSVQENLSYAIFIDIHKKSMTSKKKMRQMQFYDKLSAFIVTRTSSQCRSHHQKMFDKFKYISKIVELFKIKVGVPEYKAKFQQGLHKMKEINHTFSQLQNPEPSCAATPAEPVLTSPSQVLNTFPLEVNMLQFPYLFNNFYFFNVDCQVQEGDVFERLYQPNDY